MWEHFAEWKRISSEEESARVSLETALRGIMDHARLLDMVENFTLFEEVRGGLVKKIAKNHQFLGVNKTIIDIANLKENQGKLGVFWHTQGSGKSLSMVFFTQKILRTLPGAWTFVVVTDRDELDTQIYKTFACIDAMGMPTALINLSEIDFEALDAAFQTRKRQHVTAEQLKAALGKKLKDLTDQNPQRINFVERFQKLIDEYNTGSKNIDQFFNELKRFAHTLSVEEQRGVALGLSEEELVIFDILTRPDPVLTREQELAVQRLAKDLLNKLKSEKLILDWRLKQQARAGVQKTIRDLFRTLPQPYTVDLRQEKAARAYGFVYDTYPGGARPGMHA